MQRPERKVRGAGGVRRIGQRAGLAGVDLGEGMQLAVGLLDARQQPVDDVARGEALGGQPGAELDQGEIMQVHGERVLGNW